MLRPKASHLVERAAEKLLRSGALEDSAAQLLYPAQPASESKAPLPPPARLDKSSLFAATPRPRVVPPPLPAADPVMAVLEELPGASATDATMAIAAPPIIARDPLPADGPINPDLLQGGPAVDAVALERGGLVDWSRTRSRISEEFRLVQRQILRSAFGPGADNPLMAQRKHRARKWTSDTWRSLQSA